MTPTFCFCTSPYPYCQSIPHLGNVSAAVKADISCKLREVYYRNSLTEQKTFFPYSFHLTGLPIYQKLSFYRKQLETKPLKQVLSENKLDRLEPYVTETAQLTDPLKWYKLMVDYYTNLFNRLDLKTTLPNTHTTTQLDPQYSKFVRYLFRKLDQRNLIVQKNHFLIVCDRCSNVLGDHDRTAKQGLGVVYVDGLRTVKNSQVYFDHCSKESKKYYKNGSSFVGDALVKQIHRAPDSKWYAYIEGAVVPIETAESKEVSFKIVSSESQKLTIPTIETGIRCRCTGEGTIKPLKTLFIKFSDLDWKSKADAFISKSKNTDIVKKSLLAQSQILRDLAFLRTRGYGTTLDFLQKSDYEKDYVQSLLDSTLHNYYYGILYEPVLEGCDYVLKKRAESLQEKDYDEAIASYRYVMHATGRDLIATHCLYHYYFASLFYPQIEPTTFDCSKYIVVGNQKMSKSIGNILCWEDLEQKGLKPSDLKAFFSTSADTISPLETSPTEIKNAGERVARQCNHFKDFLNHSKKIDSSVLFWIYILALRLDLKQSNFKQSLKKIKKIAQSKVDLYNTDRGNLLSKSTRNYIKSLQKLESFKVFGCREYYYLIFSEIYNCTKNIKQQMPLDEDLRKFLADLVQTYESKK